MRCNGYGWLIAVCMVWAGMAVAETAPEQFTEHNDMMDHGDGHLMDWEGGMVMGQNTSRLPDGCEGVVEDKEITVKAGRKYSQAYPGTVFGFDQHQWEFKPCTRLTVHFINEDTIRHQWMMHGLPKYIYHQGMFHLELTGRGSISGTLILPKEENTYLVHCDIAQHMEKGMKAQLKVGKGSGDLPSIPGVTNLAVPDDYRPVGAGPAAAPAPVAPSAPPPSPNTSWLSGMLAIGLVLGLFGAPFLLKAAGGRRAEAMLNWLVAVSLPLYFSLRSWISRLRRN